MPPMGSTLRAPSLHLVIPSLRRLVHSVNHFSSSASVPLNTLPEPPPPSSTKLAVSSQRHSVEYPVSNPTKPRPKQPNLVGHPTKTRTKQAIPADNPTETRTKQANPVDNPTKTRFKQANPGGNPTKTGTKQAYPAGNPTKTRTKQAKTPKQSKVELGKTPLDVTNVHSSTSKSRVTSKMARKEYNESPSGLLQRDLDKCSKHGDTVRALELFDSALAARTPLRVHHYNCLLYLCSLPSSSDVGSGEGESSSGVALNDSEAKFNNSEVSKMAVERGFEIYKRLCEDPHVEPNESTLISLARLAAMKEHPHLAFDVVKQLVNLGIPPKHRSYKPALHGFCNALDVEMAHEVENHMDAHGVVPEEADLAALLRCNAIKGRANHVYRLLHRMRTLIRQVSEPTAEIIESWFRSDMATAVGASRWDVDKNKQGVIQGGGGWHGQGWLGTGQWRVERSVMSEDGVCKKCGEKLVCIDLDPLETEGFARSLMELPYFQKNRYQFRQFKV